MATGHETNYTSYFSPLEGDKYKFFKQYSCFPKSNRDFILCIFSCNKGNIIEVVLFLFFNLIKEKNLQYALHIKSVVVVLECGALNKSNGIKVLTKGKAAHSLE